MTKARSNATAPNAKGTLVVGNGTDASTTLAVASTAGYVLTVDSAEATGVKWAAAGGSLTLSQIASGSLSGSSLSLSSLSSYDTIMIALKNVSGSANAIITSQINSNSTSNYNYSITGISGPTTFGMGNGASVDSTIYLTFNENMLASNTGTAQFFIVFENCKSAGFTRFRMLNRYMDQNNKVWDEWTEGIFTVAATVSSLSFSLSSGTYDNGTYTVWGG